MNVKLLLGLICSVCLLVKACCGNKTFLTKILERSCQKGGSSLDPVSEGAGSRLNCRLKAERSGTEETLISNVRRQRKCDVCQGVDTVYSLPLRFQGVACTCI